MIICHTHKFIFIKGLKVASTSVEMALSLFCKDNDIVTPISPVDEYARLEMGGVAHNYSGDPVREAQYNNLIRQKRFKEAHALRVHSTTGTMFYNHMPLSLVEERSSLPVEQYDLIYCIRNPYEKIISYANMMLSFSTYSGDAMVNSTEDIQGSITKIMRSGEYKKVNNTPLYQSGLPYKSRIELRHETIHKDFDDFLSRLKLSNSDLKLPHAKKGIFDQEFSPTSLFTRAQLDEVNEVFANEFEAYGYPRL